MMGAAILLAWSLVQQPATGEQLLEAGQLDRAREAFERALKLDPGQFAALSGLGFIHYSQGRFAEARTCLEKAVLARPNSFQARFLLGATLVQLNESKAAIRELGAANKLNPAHADARKLLATEYTGSRQFKEAIALLEPVVNTPPYDEETHLLLIGARQSSGDSAGSFELASRAARRFPRSPRVAAWLGFQLQFTGRYEEAQGYLRKAIGLDPAYPVPYQLMGEVFLKLEDYAEAVSWFRKAAERMPEDVETLLGLGRALAETGDAAGGLEVLRRAARIAPGNAQVRLQLSRLYFRMGDEENARKEADLSVKLRTPGPNLVEAPVALRTPR
ncbi:MAG: tetratricopeptide repeat protein [Acidobacteria bacterium]|nr:tetratricopeptide repeat protein [Acidobacteriota bacterium]